jgi:pimeloyl-ACP methyl ester carboxylesterase
MLGVTAALPDRDSARPPIILVHGAANSASIWTFWQQELAAQGRASYAIDLRGHGRSIGVDLSTTSLYDYAADGCMLALQFKRSPIVLGWSMGGLVALREGPQAEARFIVCRLRYQFSPYPCPLPAGEGDA